MLHTKSVLQRQHTQPLSNRRPPGQSQPLSSSLQHLPKTQNKLQSLLQGQIQDYQFGNVIGQGAYSIVRRGIHIPSNQPVAVKSYDKIRVKQTHRRNNLCREIQIMKVLQHPNIVNFHQAMKSSRHIHIVTQFVNGIPLTTYMKAQLSRRLKERDAKFIFRQITDSVSYFHSMGICHRDIKLDNILIDKQIGVKIIDFGFATQGRSRGKLYCGTPSYMAPQIVSKKEYEGEPADIWALGVCLFVMLSGLYPFRGSSERELYRKIQLGQLHIPETVPVSARRLLRFMLSVNPTKRPTAAEILSSAWVNEGGQKQEKRLDQ